MTRLLSLDPTGRTWAQERLRLGLANVGTWVLLSLALVSLRPDLGSWGPAGWALVVSLYIVVQAPFDVLGGYVLPVRHHRRGPDLAGWLVDWARGVAVHGLTMLLLGWGALALGAWLGDAAVVAASWGVGVLLVAVQGPLAHALATIRRREPSAKEQELLARAGLDPSRVSIADSADRSFVGGWVGPRGLERLWLPEAWLSLPPEGLQAALLRRQHAHASGARAQGVLGALAFNGVGMALVVGLLPGAGFASVSELLLVAAGCTLWSFLGVLTLPTLSRRAVIRLDGLAASSLAAAARSEHGDASDTDPAGAVIALVQRLDRDQEDEAQRSATVETLFHPVPSPASRIDALERRTLATGAVVPWRVARMSLFTGWANLSWLPRAVHCNIGRPELWSLYPGD